MNGVVHEAVHSSRRYPAWIPFQGIMSALLYGVVSSLMIFCNKSLSSNFNFSYPLFLLWVQMAITQLGLCTMHWGKLGGFVYPRITLRGLLLHLPVAALYVLNAALAISSLQGMSIPTYGALKRATPLFILALNYASERSAMRKMHVHGDSDIEAVKPAPLSLAGPGSGVVAAVLIIVCGTLVAGRNDLHLSSETLLMALTSNVTQALYVTMVESKHKSRDGGGFSYGKTDPTLGLLTHNSLLSMPLLGAVVFALGWLDGGCSLNYTMFLCIRHNSALTTSLVGHAKTAVQTVVGFFVLAHDVQATFEYVGGLILNAFGALLFSLAKYHESERKQGNLRMMQLPFWTWLLSLLGLRFDTGVRASLQRAAHL